MFNAAGFTSAWFALDAIVTRRRGRLAWSLPAWIVSAWLATAFHGSLAGPPVPFVTALGSESKSIAMNLGGFAIAAIVAYAALRRFPARRAAAGTGPAAAPAATIAWNHGTAQSDAALRDALARFLGAADVGDFATAEAIYDAGFTCVRVADAGGFVRLSREQMLAFWRRAVADAGEAAARGGGASTAHATVTTRATTVHHVEVTGDDALVLLTREKDLGAGFEPLFYTLAWRRADGAWRLRREFVHQRSAPNFG